MQTFFFKIALALAVLVSSLVGTSAISTGASAYYAETHELNLKSADLSAFIDDVSEITGFTFIVDPKVTGKVTVTSNHSLDADTVFKVFLSTLRVHGFSAVPVSEGVYKIVPSEAARMDGSAGDVTGRDNEVFVTEVVRLATFDAVEAAKMVKPIIHPAGHVGADPGSNTLFVVDTRGNMERVKKILSELDRDRSVFESIPLTNMSAKEAERVLRSLQTSQSGEDANLSSVSIVAVEGTNTLLIRGERAAVSRLASVARRLDNLNRSEGDLSVVYLRNAKAEELVPILQELTKTLNETAPTKASIAFHGATNALVINADPETKKSIINVIRQLDVRRAQVMVEAIIVEISDATARQLGLQFMLAGGEKSNLPFAATSFSKNAPNILALTGAIASADGNAEDANEDLVNLALDSLLGVSGLTGGIGGQSSDGTLFGVILNAVQEDTGSNILSTPHIMTLDNEPATFLVGQEIPITTGESLGSNNTNPFRTIDRQDVGIQLSVLPQINEGDSIRLHILQEVSSVFGPVSDGFSELVTNKRSLETTILADDGEIIVLGGLIEESTQLSEKKVPLLGDIPGVGRLFKSKGKSKTKTNLMVFIRPTIVRDVDDARAVTNRKYGYIQAEQLLRGYGQAESLDKLLKDVIGDGRDALPKAPAGSQDD